MKNKNIKVIDEHNIDRDANVMFALELEGSEYVVYWISRDEESNNVFVSKMLKNLDGTNNMLNIDDDDKKKEIAEIVKTLVSSAVTDQNDKMPGVTMSLSNGKTVKFISASFNKEQQINVSKTYITTVKKEVTKVAETYYDVVAEEVNVEPTLTAVPVVEATPEIFPELNTLEAAPSVVEPITVTPIVEPAPSVVEPQPVVLETPVVEPVPVAATPVVTPVAPVVEPTPSVVAPQPVVLETPVVEPVPVAATPVVTPVTPVVEPAPSVVEPQPVVLETPVVEPVPVAATPVETPVSPVVEPTPSVVAPQPVVDTASQPLVFNATKETNLNAALGEVASSATIPVEDINSVREFGVETPVVSQPAVQQTPVAPMVQPEVAEVPKTLTKKAGFANSKFFVVVAITFFLASCVFLGYEVFNYFQLVK